MTQCHPRFNRTNAQVIATLLLIFLSANFDIIASEASLAHCSHLDDKGNPGAVNCYQQLLNTDIDDVKRGEALWRIDDYEGANRAFRRANQAMPGNADLLTRWGMLFLEVTQLADAEVLFKQALEIDPGKTQALLGQAELFANRFEARSQELINEVLNHEPDNPRALLLLARLQLEVGNVELAQGQLDRILARSSSGNDDLRIRLDAYALLAAVEHSQGHDAGKWTEKALQLNPRFADIYAVPAYFYVITRRYSEAVLMLQQAIELDPNHWRAHSDLGLNLLRLNRFEEAQKHLELAYSGYPFSAEIVNTLRLLDSLEENFSVFESPNMLFRAHKSESAVLTPYIQDQVDQVEREMAARYDYKLVRPVVVEFYQHHDDFAVRTAGLPGIGILGATFGDVIVMDGPSAKSAEEFDWSSALWHELAHVVTLNATNNLVSRWFSEGVSVMEEWRYGPSPTDSIPTDFLQALKEDKLLPVASLDEGFIRPTYANQIMISYLQAGLMCLFIADQFENGLVGMLQAYRRGAKTPEAIEQALGVTPDELDEQFGDYLDGRFGPVVKQLDVFTESLSNANIGIAEERWEDARIQAEQAMRSYPDYTGPNNPYLILARIFQTLSQPEKANSTLQEYWRLGGRDTSALGKLAGIYFADNNVTEAVAVQRVLSRAQPLDIKHHITLGEWLLATNHHSGALREFQAALALSPHDKANIHFKLASALHALERTTEARRELLYALEIAPRYYPALSLLVEINK